MNSFCNYVKFISAICLLWCYRVISKLGMPVVPLALGVVQTADEQILAELDKLGDRFNDYSRFQKETKQALEELTVLKNSFADVQQTNIALRKAQLSMGREHRLAYGDPVKRIQVDQELRTRLNAAVRLACKDPAIRAIGENLASPFLGRSLTSGSTPGSTLITSDLASEIYDTLATYGVWNTFAVQRVGRATTKFPVTTARPVAKAVRKLSGSKLVEDSTLAGTSVDCEVVLWGVLLGVERELLEDGEYDVTSYVMENFSEAMALKLDELCLTADGTDDETDSGMSGIFTTGTAAAAAAGNITVETTDLDDWVKCLTTVDAGVLNRPCRWWIHPRNLARALLVRDLNGRPIFQTALEAPAFGGVGSILGYPVTPSHAAPSTSAASAKIAAFGELQQK